MRGRSGIEGKFFLDGSLVYRPSFVLEIVNNLSSEFRMGWDHFRACRHRQLTILRARHSIEADF